MQALIGNYAVPILDEKQVWGTSDETKTAYLDSMVRPLKYSPTIAPFHMGLSLWPHRRPFSAAANKHINWASHDWLLCLRMDARFHAVLASLTDRFFGVPPLQRSGVQDVAKMALAALRSDATVGKTITLSGPKAWTVQEVIELCEKLAGAEADVTQVPVWLLRATRNFLRSFQWARDAADRLVRHSAALSIAHTMRAPRKLAAYLLLSYSAF